MPRVLHVSQPVDAGVPAVVLRYVADQVERGLDVAVACPNGPLADSAAGMGADVHRWEATRSPGPSVPAEVRALRAVLERGQPDIVHLHSAKAGLAGRLAVRGRRPTLFQPHAWSFDAVTGPVAHASLLWERMAVRWTDRIVCVAHEEADRGRANGVRGSYIVVPNSLDPRAYPPVAADSRHRARVTLGLETSAPLAVCLGRLARQKGQDALLQAWPRVVEQVADARLVLVGDGPDREALTEQSRGLPNVDLVGPTDAATTWLLAADVVVVPSRWEGMALVPLEARACARPVVASAATGLAETVTPDTGAVVDLYQAPNGREAFARAVTARLSDPARAAREGALARVQTEASWQDPPLELLVDTYRTLMDRH